MTQVMEGHILLDENGAAWIDQTNTKVIEIVLHHLAHQWSAKKMHEELPHLSVAQIYSALSYYHDHKPQFDAEISRESQDTAGMRAANLETPGRVKLREQSARP